MAAGRPSLAVAMATHNGERFLAAQLESLAAQTRLPDELVVHDDCSQDRTLEVLEKFTRQAPFPVKLIGADSRRGYADGFLCATRSCRTDLVAFCDQDDIWRPDKLERCIDEFERDPQVRLVAHSWVIPAGTRAARRRPRLRSRRRRVTNPRSTPFIWPPGFSMVISRGLLEVWEWAGRPSLTEVDWGHDDWFTFVASALGTVVLLPDELVLYRQHDANVLGAPPADLSGRVRSSVAPRGAEAELFRSLSDWARDQVQVLQALHRELPQLSTEFDPDGPTARLPLWERVVVVNERRADFYALRAPGGRAVTALLTHVLQGDYGSRAAAGLGLSSLVRDALHAAGLLDGVANLTGHPAGSGT